MPIQRGLPTWQLFTIAVAIWSTTWHAILYQLEHTPPEAGVALRFALAGALALSFAAWRGDRLRCSAAEHGRIALQGVFMYSLAYVCVYHAENHVASGLVAVGYSASPLMMGIAAWLLWRNALTPRFLVGGVLCIAGVAMIFAPEFGGLKDGAATLRGALFTAGAVALSAIGSLIASRNAKHQLPFWPTIGWGMVYSALSSALLAAASGQTLTVPTPAAAPAWWLSLAYLAIAGSVIAFACFLRLQERVGPGAASTVGVMTPVFAMIISALFEGLRPVPLTWLGVAFAVLGNTLILRPKLSPDGARATG
ncbi:MAG: EamA family transporter [Pseudomonadota bacterium]